MSIRLEDLHKAFGKNTVLDGFSLEVNEGETLSIIGYSGAGKSVTLKHINGLLKPDLVSCGDSGMQRIMIYRRDWDVPSL